MKPKMIIDKHGTKTWGINGLLHRTDGPAVEHIMDLQNIVFTVKL